MTTKTRPPLHQGPAPLRSAALTEVVDRTYDIFARHKLVGPLDVCTACCVTPEEAETLTKTPLRDLSCELLRQFNDSAPSKTNPSFDQLNYFLHVISNCWWTVRHRAIRYHSHFNDSRLFPRISGPRRKDNASRTLPLLFSWRS